MNSPLLSFPSASTEGAFTPEQKEYLAGFLAGIVPQQLHPYVGHLPGTGALTADPTQGGTNLAVSHAEQSVHGMPLSELSKQELWKRELHGLDAWDRLLEHAEQNKYPDEADTFRFRYHG